jgi:hypothetical protein
MYTWVFQVVSFLQISHQKPTCISLLPYMYHMLHPSLSDLIAITVFGEEYKF